MYRNHSVAVVVPAYNEEGFVGDVVDTLPAFVDRAYVVDDCSTDGTWEEILERVQGAPRDSGSDGEAPDPGTGPSDTTVTDGGEATAAGSPASGTGQGSRATLGTASDAPTDAPTEVVPVRHEENRGVGAAIKTGYRRALQDGVELVAVMAGDGQMDPDELDRLLDPLVEGRADYAKANRLRSADHWDGMSRFRLFGNGVLTLLTKVSSGYWELLDPQNGYTVATRSTLETVDLERTYDDYGFTNDLLARLNRHDVRVAHVDVPAEYGEETSNIHYPSYVVNVSGLLASNFLWRLKHKYVLGSFHPFVVTYVFGATITALGSLAVLGAVAGAAAGVTGWTPLLLSLVLFAVGGQSLLSAMETEASLHEDLEVQVT